MLESTPSTSLPAAVDAEDVFTTRVGDVAASTLVLAVSLRAASA